MTTLQFFLLGPAQFRRDGEPVELSNAKAVALLTYLAVTGVPQSREHLVDLLWPDSLPEAARKNLRNTLWGLRKAWGDEVLSGETDRLGLAGSVWTDVQHFTAEAGRLLAADTPDTAALQAAGELYRGPLVDGLALAEAPDFEIWLTGERERLGQLYLRLLERLVAGYEAAANWPDVVSTARRALAHDNLQEPMVQALMEAHARLGERAEALRQYDTLKATLARELGVEPLPETERLRAAILAGSLPVLDPSAPAAPAGPRRGPKPLPRPSLPFVGRQAELAALDEELARATAGQARIVLLTGEMGIGKSRLWQVWSATLPAGLTVLETTCLDTTQSLPFAPLTSLFRRQSCLARLAKPPSPLSPIWLVELARLLPEIREYWPKLPASTPLPPEEERRRLFEAFTQALQALATRPLVLFIDDLHWADRGTLDWLVYLLDRLRAEPLLLVAAYRPQDAPAELARLVAGWSRQGLVHPLRLARLSLPEAADLVAALGGDVALAGQLQAKSAGNPYFLLELSRTGPDTPPAGLVELVRDRLGRLPDTARQVLQAAAVLEGNITPALLRRTSGRSEEETLDALDVLLAADVLAERDSGYKFVHPLVAAIVQADLNLGRRSFLHRRAAEALETLSASHPEAAAGQLAAHYEQAGRPAQAAHYTDLAARQALALAAPAEAAAFYRRALILAPSPTRRLGLGQALFNQGELEAARETYQQALAEAEAGGDRRAAIRACLALAESYMPSGQNELVIAWTGRALTYLDVEEDPESHARVHFLRGAASLSTGRDLAEAEADLAEAARLAVESRLPTIAALSRFELGNLAAERGDLARSVTFFRETIPLAQASGDHYLEVLAQNNLAYHTLLAGNLTEAGTAIETGLALAETYSLFVPCQYLYSTRGELALAAGQFDEAESWLNRALAEATRYGNRVQAANIEAILGLVARERGDLDEALMRLSAAAETAAHFPAPHLRSQLDLWLAELYLQRDERAAAAAALARAEARLAGTERRGLLAWAERVRGAVEET